MSKCLKSTCNGLSNPGSYHAPYGYHAACLCGPLGVFQGPGRLFYSSSYCACVSMTHSKSSLASRCCG